MKIVIRHFFKDNLEEEWKRTSLFCLNVFDAIDVIRLLKKEHRFVRQEMQRKDSMRTFVWEYDNGTLIHEPVRGDKPCKASGFNQYPNNRRK